MQISGRKAQGVQSESRNYASGGLENTNEDLGSKKRMRKGRSVM